MFMYWWYKIVLHCYSIINYYLNYFKIIILKINKLNMACVGWLYKLVYIFNVNFFSLLWYQVFLTIDVFLKIINEIQFKDKNIDDKQLKRSNI